MIEMLTKPAKMQQAIDSLTGFIERIEVLLISIDAHLASIDEREALAHSDLTKDKN